MMQSIGRGISGLNRRRTFVSHCLVKALPSVYTYTRNDTVATYRDNTGKLRKVSAANTPRFDHDLAGLPLGLLVEASIQNKVSVYNALPTNTTGLTTSGTASVSVVTDATALTAAGLDQLITGNVIQAVGGGSGGNITLSGTTGNTSVHSFSVYARITAGTSATLTHTGTSAGTQTISGATWTRFMLDNETISGSGVQMRITVPAGVTVLFILPQMEQNRFSTSPIITSGSAATRQRDDVSISLSGKRFWNETTGWLFARYRVMGNMAVDQHPVIAHSGNSNNCIGIRLAAATFYLQGNVRANSTIKMSLSGNLDHALATNYAGLITWKSGYACVSGQGGTVSGTYSGDPTGLTTLQIGARSGGNDQFFGHIAKIEIGRQCLNNATQITRRLNA